MSIGFIFSLRLVNQVFRLVSVAFLVHDNDMDSLYLLLYAKN